MGCGLFIIKNIIAEKYGKKENFRTKYVKIIYESNFFECKNIKSGFIKSGENLSLKLKMINIQKIHTMGVLVGRCSDKEVF